MEQEHCNVWNVRWSSVITDSTNHRSLASCTESMRPTVVGASLGAWGVASGTAEWCSWMCLRRWECLGRRCLENDWVRDNLENDWVMNMRMICKNVLSSTSGSLMRCHKWRNTGVDKTLTKTDVPSVFSFSEYLKRKESRLVSPLIWKVVESFVL